MVHLVARAHKRQRPHRYFLLTGHPAPRPGCLWERPKECYACASHQPELFCKTCECALTERSVLHKIILFESREGRLVATREAQGPAREYPLRVRDVSQDFFYRPLSQSMPEASVSLASASEQLQHLQSLGFQNAQDIGP